MENKNSKILLVDDEQDILDFLGYNLSKEGYTIFTATNGSDAIKIAKNEIPDLIILDVMMPELDGMETCRQLREIDFLNQVVIAFLTARNEDYSQITGFDMGADDYITKPIKPRVLSSRIKALLRRHQITETTIDEVNLGAIKIDKERFCVIKNGQEIVLPKKEFQLLSLLATKPGKVFTRELILQEVWGDEVIIGERTIDVHIRKLREKIGEEFIKTIKGIGYKFEF